MTSSYFTNSSSLNKSKEFCEKEAWTIKGTTLTNYPKKNKHTTWNYLNGEEVMPMFNPSNFLHRQRDEHAASPNRWWVAVWVCACVCNRMRRWRVCTLGHTLAKRSKWRWTRHWNRKCENDGVCVWVCISVWVDRRLQWQSCRYVKLLKWSSLDTTTYLRGLSLLLEFGY